jgi:predicted AlkP superfamily phosphohydrolase/phosphomutase
MELPVASNTSVRKVVVIGLDCVEPSLLFDAFRGQLPNLEGLMARGSFGRLRSCDPPITVPAWSVMTSSKDPGTLGIYGFRNRADYSYHRLSIANSTAVREPRIWDYLGNAGKQVIVLGVPGTFPVRKVSGVQIGCFLTPTIDSDYTYPSELKHEIASVVGSYMIDVPNFRTDDKARLRADIFAMTEKRFTLARHLLRTKPWDFFMMVEMGTDRVHHGFWKYMDRNHPKYVPGNPWENVIVDYYRYVDKLVGELLREVPADADILVVSDHGAKAMHGGICINEWLIKQGHLVLKRYPDQVKRFDELEVDWSKTRAWGEGGYYGRIFINVAGREPQGIVAPAEYEAFRQRLGEEIEAIPDENGRPIGTACKRPQDLYKRVSGIAPDLLAYFGQLRWRSVGTVGQKSVHTFENDTGPDDANHAEHGIFVLAGPDIPAAGMLEGRQLMDIAPTVLELFGIDVPNDMQGVSILDAFDGTSRR